MAIRTLCDILENLDSQHQKPALLRYKQDGNWRDISTEDFVSTVRSLAMGMLGLGIQRGDRVAILSENRPEWLAFDHAVLAIGAVIVPIYPTLHATQVSYILKNSQARALVVSNAAQLEKMTPVLGEIAGLERLVVMDAPETLPPGAVSWARLVGDGQAALAAGPGRLDEERNKAQPDDLASILYTSGTTGDPKGVMLTHENFASNVRVTLELVRFNSQDEALSFLPLTHVFERMLEFTYLAAGASISYAESIEAVPQNIAEIRPTVVASVPRLFEKVRARVFERANRSSAVGRAIFAAALAIGRRRALALLRGGTVPPLARLLHPLTDRLVFAKLRARLGGRLRFFISGGAPLGRDVAEFFYAASITVLEGYGLTETSPVCAVNLPGQTKLGTVGKVIPGVKVRIAEDGEILVKGPNVMRGYFRNEEATRDALRDGWFHTGDIGHLDDEGYLEITDRKKEILKTSGGKMVAPQPIENLLKGDRFISQAVLIGDRRKFISALIAPDPQRIESYARHKGISYDEPAELLEDSRVLDLYRRRIEEKMKGLSKFERVKKFRLLPRELSQEDGELTPTLKIKRRVVEKNYAALIDSMYQD